MGRAEIPGTFADGFEPAPLLSFPVPSHAIPAGVRGLAAWMMGECKVVRFRDDEGLHLTVSHESRYPSWDEIKVARYRLLPLERTFALVLPPPDEYVDMPERRNIFELAEVEKLHKGRKASSGLDHRTAPVSWDERMIRV